MALLVNAFSTLRRVPPASFPHRLVGARDRREPGLIAHLRGLAGYIAQQGGGPMNATRYATMRHAERVQNQYAFQIDDAVLPALYAWAREANAIVFLPDGTVRDVEGRRLLDPSNGRHDDGASVPYVASALARKQRSEAQLRAHGLTLPSHLPPVIGDEEVVMRSASEAVRRAFALFLVAVKGESWHANEPLPLARMQERLPRGFDDLTVGERAFLESESPTSEQVIDHVWRYEALSALWWALGRQEELSLATAICDVAELARSVLSTDADAAIAGGQLRPLPAILDALDLHYRLHWLVRQARLDQREPPADLDAGVVLERHRALNWLVRFGEADWDDVDTPT